MEATRLRPMKVGEIFDNVLFIIRRNFRTLVKLHFVLFLPVMVVLSLVALVFVLIYYFNPFLIKQLQTPGSAVMIGGIVLLALGTLVMVLVLMVLMYFNMYGIYRIFQAGLEGEAISWRTSLKGSLRGTLYFFIATLVVSAVSFPLNFGLNLLRFLSPLFSIPQIILTNILQSFTWITLPVIALEGIDPLNAIWRSCKLIWHNFWRTIGIYILFFLLTTVVYTLAIFLCIIPFLVLALVKRWSLMVEPNWEVLLLDPWFITATFFTVSILLFLGFIFFMANFGLQVMVLNDLRMRSEGYDLLPKSKQDIATLES